VPGHSCRGGCLGSVGGRGFFAWAVVIGGEAVWNCYLWVFRLEFDNSGFGCMMVSN